MSIPRAALFACSVSLAGCGLAYDFDTPETCGNGTEDSGEVCDDGDTTTETECPYGTPTCTLCNGDCTATLELTGRYCGDGVDDAEEGCDPGTADTASCDYAGGTAPHACTAAECGDGYHNTAAGELCDGGPADTASCDYAGGTAPHACTPADCGDGYANSMAGEECDEGQANTANCDYHDGVSAHACTLARCGDGYINAPAGETCEDGDWDNADDCPDGVNGTCKQAHCGDGHTWTVGGSEQCDGGSADSADCDYDGGTGGQACTPAECGDGYINSAAGETCEDNNADNADNCPDGIGGTCRAAECGDGHVWTTGGTEVCDGGPADTWDCDWAGGSGAQACTPSDCGDTYVNSAADEGCDDGNQLLGDSCHPACLVDPFASVEWLNEADVDPRFDGKMQAATDGAGNWVVVWVSDDDLGGTIGHDTDILVARSSDGGATWSAAAALNDYADTDSVADGPAFIATAGDGSWVAVWHTQYTMGDTIGDDLDVLFSRSTDNGATWSPAAPLNDQAAGDGTAQDYEAKVVSDGASLLLAVWTSGLDVGGAIGTDNDILYSRSTDGGVTWSSAAALNPNAGSDGDNLYDLHPYLASDGAGSWVAVWTTYESSMHYVCAARSTDNGLNWGSQATLSPSWTDNYSPRVAGHGGSWVVVWMSEHTLGDTLGSDPDIFLARSTDNAATWQANTTLNNDATTDGYSHDSWPAIAVDGSGNWVGIWYRDGHGTFARSTNGGAAWTNPAFVGPDYYSAYPLEVVPGGGTNWLAIWESRYGLDGSIGSDPDVLAVRSTDEGASWGSAVVVNSNATSDSDGGGEDVAPQLVTDGNGVWVAVWSYDGSTGGAPWGEDSDILFARSTNNGSTWSTESPVNSYAASDSGSDEAPWLATDGAGNWVVVWQSTHDDGSLGADTDILVSTSTNDGVTWTPAVALNNSASTDSAEDVAPVVVSSGPGFWLAAWESEHDLGGTIDADADILFATSLDEGGTWTDPEPLNTNANTDSGEDRKPRVAMDSSGKVVAVWQSTDDLGTIGTDLDILVATSANYGGDWSQPAALDADAASDGAAADEAPDVTTDGSDAWVAVWQHDGAIWAATSTDGVWGDAVVVVGANSAGNTAPRVYSDGTGNWVAVWSSSNDYQGGDLGSSDVWLARSWSNGLSWGTPTPVNANAGTTEENDDQPVFAADGLGRWVIAWVSDDDLDLQIQGDADILFSVATVP